MSFGRQFLVTIALIALPLIATTASDSAERPNVLFIAVDDLNDWIGCLKGHPQALTPNIDRLAARGVLFTNAHCAAPACNPSRAAIFSGQMPDVTTVWSNDSKRLNPTQLSVPLLPMAFAKSGYRTLGTGKLLHSGGSKAFDEYFQVEQRWSPLTKKSVEYTAKELPSKATDDPRHIVHDARGRSILLPLNRMPSDRAPEKKDGESFDWGPFDVPDSEFGDTQITDWAMTKMEQRGDQPFFLGVGYYRPHIPLWAPKRFFDRFQNEPAELPDVIDDDLDDLSDVARRWAIEPITAGSHGAVLKHDQWQAAVEAYLACITYVDYEIGRLLDALDTAPCADNTVIVLWSDHGWHLGEKQHWGKWTGWERSTRVPLIIVPPKNQSDRFAAAGSRCDQPVGLIDLYPTLTQLCGVTPPEGLDGQSLVPLLHDPAQRSERVVVTMFDPGNVSLRSDHWRMIRYADGSQELYDHRNDPHEWHNLADDKQHVGRKDSLNRILTTYLDRNK
ncbi:sulfatase [Novipirellula sp. SH528]|uniref:sulfatase n=1 Tax=Novipirellula sp. SH528 TaxID=3454466 RepID=UPI003FA02AB7